MRRLGVGVLGGIGGVLLALIVQDLLVTVFRSDGTVPAGLSIVFGLLMPVSAGLGAVMAILLDRRGAP